MRVTLKASSGDSTAIPLLFGKLIGRSEQALTVSSIALYDADKYLALGNGGSSSSSSGSSGKTNYVSRYVPATSNLWLAGDAAGTIASTIIPA